MKAAFKTTTTTFLACMIFFSMSTVSFCNDSATSGTKAGSAPAIAEKTFELAPEVKALFEQITGAYRDARTYQAEVVLTVKLVAGASDSESSLTTNLAWEKPNLIRTASRDDTPGAVMVCDGKKFYKYLPNLGEYTVKDAPGDFRNSEAMNSGALGQTGGISDISSSDDPSGALMKNLFKAVEQGGETVQGRPCRVLLLEKTLPGNRPGNVTIRLFTDMENGLIRKMIFDNTALLPESKGPEKRLFKIIEEHRDIRINQPLPANVFAFTPPSESRRVNEFAFEKDRKAAPRIHPLEGSPAPGFELTELTGKTHTLAEYKGRWVLLFFWSSIAPGSVRELPILQKAASLIAEKNIVVLTVNPETEDKPVTDFLNTHAIEITVLRDREKTVSTEYRIQSLPSLYVINREGIVHKVISGIQTEEELSAFLDAIENL
ncbi:MAG TPA: redoxin domain-containing protein [Candidatus Sumerlaeota bacterium]|nr:redoxin domain-containing protein [Candidatus Sumerlaeota bacterium]